MWDDDSSEVIAAFLAVFAVRVIVIILWCVLALKRVVVGNSHWTLSESFRGMITPCSIHAHLISVWITGQFLGNYLDSCPVPLWQWLPPSFRSPAHTCRRSLKFVAGKRAEKTVFQPLQPLDPPQDGNTRSLPVCVVETRIEEEVPLRRRCHL